MKQSIIIILLTMLMGMISIKAFADFEAKNADGITIRYRILNEGKYDEGLNVEGFQYDAEKLVIPKSVDYNGKTYPVKYMISSSAYSAHPNLTSIVFQCELKNHSIGIFKNCENLKEVTFDCNYTTLSFQNSTSIEIITLTENVSAILNDSFSGCSGLTTITIPNSVTYIGHDAFKGCSNMTSITIPNSVTSIDYNAFKDCSCLKSITIGNSVKTIGNSSFSGCKEITSLIIGNNVTTISDQAFYGCSKLTSVIIPNSVTSIGESAFEDCSDLISITISDNIGSVAKY